VLELLLQLRVLLHELGLLLLHLFLLLLHTLKQREELLTPSRGRLV
jgi:hypothetical protein